MRCAALVALLAMSVGAACERHATPDERASVALPQTTAEPAPHLPPALDDLRTAHPDAAAAEGVPCGSDLDCESPLRCFDASCVFPPSMTGRVNEGMAYVAFDGEHLTDARYYLEVADERWEQTRGLMHRRSMVQDMGMIFDFGVDRPQSFWMRNTYIPLDMIFVTDAGVVDSFVEGAVPETDTPRASRGPARYVIELNEGEVARMGLRRGDPARIVRPEQAPPAPQ